MLYSICFENDVAHREGPVGIVIFSDGPFFNARYIMLIKKDPDLISAYLKDYSNIDGGHCDYVVFPQDEEEIRDFLAAASKDSIPVTISGAGTGVTGARVPFGGTVISTEKLNSIIDIRETAGGGGEAIVEPGVALSSLLEEAEKRGYFYPPDPTEKGSFVGGNISTSASGARSFKFGSTRDYVKEVRAVLSTGDMIEIERGKIFADKDRYLELPKVSGGAIRLKLPRYNIPRVKNAAGYYIKEGMDAIDLFIGSEGTLGVLTKARLRLLAKPDNMLDCYAFFKKQDDALGFAYAAREASIKSWALSGNINAASIEFFDSNALRFLSKKHDRIPKAANGAIYFQQEINRETESDILDSWASLICERNGSLDDTWFAQSERDKQELAGIRHDLPDMVNEFLKKRKMSKIGTDIAVDPAHIDEMIRFYTNTISGAGLKFVIFGHIGECHLHVNILPEDEEGFKKGLAIYESFVKKAISLKGTISAEHGIGKIKHKYLEMMYGKEAVNDMAALKRALDPALILGLDNIFPKELIAR